MRAHWPVDVALVVLVWRAAINPVASLWRDAPFVIAAYVLLTVVFRLKAETTETKGGPVVSAFRRKGAPGLAFEILTVAIMGLLLVAFALRQVPLTLNVLGFGP